MFIDSMRFMSSSLDKLVKNVSDEDFKYLVEEFSSENLELLKQKCAYPDKYMNSLFFIVFLTVFIFIIIFIAPRRMEKLVMMLNIKRSYKC